jgi:2-oxoacid:acceptor oxidoreductase delta subunit (pyruvate/2-ketoisovalerate family)
VLDAAKCNACLLCYLYCPDGAIEPAGNIIAFDYDFCKGCGICAKICRFGAISMRREKEWEEDS